MNGFETPGTPDVEGGYTSEQGESREQEMARLRAEVGILKEGFEKLAINLTSYLDGQNNMGEDREEFDARTAAIRISNGMRDVVRRLKEIDPNEKIRLAKEGAFYELARAHAQVPEGFTSMDEALDSLKREGDVIRGKLEGNKGEWEVTRGKTGADFVIKSGGEEGAK